VARRRRGNQAARVRLFVEKRADARCEYCHAPQRVSGYRYHIEHIVPRALGGTNALRNRALACATCNLAKANRTQGTDRRTGVVLDLFNPRTQLWREHFRWAKDRQTLLGRTATGRATVATLDMNSEVHGEARQFWFATGWLP
jgi:5-methylcytosine-specific restriction endonuclease McrA